MKIATLLLLLSSFAIGTTTMAAEMGGSESQAENAVIRAAHNFIKDEAPDWGGHVNSPCKPAVAGDQFVIVCSGMAYVTMAGDGEWKRQFECQGDYSKGPNGQWYRLGRIDCQFK